MARLMRAMRELRIDLERAAEALGGRVVVVLLEIGDADVVGAIGVLARRGALRERRTLAAPTTTTVPPPRQSCRI